GVPRRRAAGLRQYRWLAGDRTISFHHAHRNLSWPCRRFRGPANPPEALRHRKRTSHLRGRLMADPIAPPPVTPTFTDETKRGRFLLDKESFLGPIMLLPAVIYIIALVGIPLVIAIAYAFSDVTVGDQSIDWVGLENFRDTWNNPTFQKSLKNSLVFTFV